MVSFANSTLDKAELFEEKLRELESLVPLIVFRTFISTGKKPKNIDSATFEKMVELQELRADGISGEMRYAKAQARAKGLTISEDILTAKSIAPGFSKAVTDSIPNLEVYKIFAPYTAKELEKIAEIQEKKEESDPNKNSNQIASPNAPKSENFDDVSR